MLDIICFKQNPARFSSQIISISATNRNSTYSNINIIRGMSAVDDTKKYATLEPQGWKLDGSYSLYDDEKFVFWGSTVASSSGTLSNNTITITFQEEITLSEIGGATIIADTTTPIIAITCETYNGDTLISRYTHNEKKYIYYCPFVAQDEAKITKVRFKFGSTLPQRRLKIKNILFGIAEQITEDKFYDVKIIEEISIPSDRIPANTLSFTLSANQTYIDNLQKKFRYITLFKDGVQYGGYYLDNIEKQNDNKFTLSGIDIIGVLEDIPYNDNLFISIEGRAITVIDVLQSIFDSVDCNYILSGFDNSEISIKFQSLNKRDALTHLLLSINAVCIKLRNGTLVFSRLSQDIKTDITYCIYSNYKIVDNVPVASISMNKVVLAKGNSMATSGLSAKLIERGVNYVIFDVELPEPVWSPTVSAVLSYFVHFTDSRGKFAIESTIPTTYADKISYSANHIYFRMDTEALLGERNHYEWGGRWLYRGTRDSQWTNPYISTRIKDADWSTFYVDKISVTATNLDGVTLAESDLMSTVTNPNELNSLKTRDLQIQTVQIASLIVDNIVELEETTETSVLPIIDEQGQDTGETETVTNVVPINLILPKMMDRYYQYPKVLEAKILSEGLQCGDTVSVTLPYIGNTTGTIQKLESNFVNKEIADAQILLYYTG